MGEQSYNLKFFLICKNPLQNGIFANPVIASDQSKINLDFIKKNKFSTSSSFDRLTGLIALLLGFASLTPFVRNDRIVLRSEANSRKIPKIKRLLCLRLSTDSHNVGCCRFDSNDDFISRAEGLPRHVLRSQHNTIL